MYKKKKQDCIRITGQILYRCQAKQFTFPPNSVSLLWWWCGNRFFFFSFSSFPFFPLPCKSFQRLQSPTKKKIFHTESVWVSSRIFACGALDFFFFCIVDVMPVSAADGPNHRCSHSHVLTRLNSILAFNIRTNELTRQRNVRRETKKSIYVCVYVLICICIHTHTQIYIL